MSKKRPNPRIERFMADLETLDRLVPHLAEAVERMRAARLGYPQTSMGGGGSGSGASPIERVLLRADGSVVNDEGREALHQADRLVSDLHSIAERWHHLVSKWAPRQPDAKARKATEEANIVECVHHRATIGAHEDLHVHSDVAGNLEHPMALCRYCYEFVRRNGRLPSTNELDRVRKGQRVRLPA
jgi:hypothetical protein